MSTMLGIAFSMSCQTDVGTVGYAMGYSLYPVDEDGLGSLLLGGTDVYYTVTAEEECKSNHLTERPGPSFVIIHRVL